MSSQPAQVTRLPTAGPTRPLVTFVRAGEIKLRSSDWLIKGLLVANTNAALVGPSGSGKSAVALSMGYHVAMGLPYFGREVQQGGVFYIPGEGRAGVRKRLAALESYHRHPLGDAPLFVADTLPFLCEDLNTISVIDAIQQAADSVFFRADAPEPKLIIIDTVARAMSGANENSAEDMGAFVRAMDWIRTTWGATVLAIHHTGHGDQERARGSSAFFAAMDTELLVKPGRPNLTLRTTKAKDWPEAEPISMRWHELEVGVPSLDVEGVPITVPEPGFVLVDDEGAIVQRSKQETVAWYAEQGHTQRATARETGMSLTTVNRLWPKAHGPP